MEIQYCGGCGKLLREADFSKGLARFADNRPYCAECRPPEPVPLPPPASPKRTGSSAKLPRITPSSTRLHAQAAKPASSAGIFVGLGAAAALLLIVVLVLMSGGDRGRHPPPVHTDPKTTSKPPADAGVGAKPPAFDPALLKRLEELEASAGDPDELLAASDGLRPKLRYTPYESRLKALEDRLQERRAAKVRAGQVDLALAEAAKIEEADPLGRRAEAVRRLLRAASEIAGERRPQVEAALAGYEKRLSTAPLLGRDGPHGLDGEGWIRHWLVAGGFPNVDHEGFTLDHLGGEAAAAPKAGDRAGGKTWRAVEAPGPALDFLAIGEGRRDQASITYVFALVEAVEEREAELRVGSDDGVVLWVDGTEVARVHVHRRLMPDQERYALRLPKGFHRLLLKVEQGDGDHGVQVRFTDAQGNAARGLRIWR
jgi:hypothetical protein